MSDGPEAAAASGGESAEEAPAVVAITERWPELAVAGFLMLLAVIDIVDSVRVGTGWADDGPRAGYFPFYIGLILLGASGWIFVRTLMRWRQLGGSFVSREELGGVWAVLWPSAVYAALMTVLGLYVASMLLIGYFMRRHGRYGWLVSVIVSIGVPVVFYLVFERWFLVPLPKGPLEAAIGL